MFLTSKTFLLVLLALLFDLESIPLASIGFVVRGPTWETLSRRFSHAVNLLEISVPLVSKPYNSSGGHDYYGLVESLLAYCFAG